MPDAVRPQDVLADGLKDKLIDAMKYAFMRKGAFDSGELQGLEWRDDENKVGGSSWKYRINLGVLVNDPEITCDSSGNWRHEQFIGGDDSLSPGSNFIDANDNAYEVILPDAAAKWQEIEDFVEDWVQPWVEGITPKPERVHQPDQQPGHRRQAALCRQCPGPGRQQDLTGVGRR